MGEGGGKGRGLDGYERGFFLEACILLEARRHDERKHDTIVSGSIVEMFECVPRCMIRTKYW